MKKYTFSAYVALFCDVLKAFMLLFLQLEYELTFRVQARQSLEVGKKEGRKQEWKEGMLF